MEMGKKERRSKEVTDEMWKKIDKIEKEKKAKDL